MSKRDKIFGVGIALAILVIGFIFGKLAASRSVSVNNYAKPTADERGNAYSEPYDFINPLLDCGDIANLSNQSVDKIKEKVFDLIDDEKEKGIEDAAVYFRDLNNGPWFGLNEREDFLPASLLKVPLMMSAFKQNMDDPSFFTKQFIWQGPSENSIEHFKDKKELEVGKSYSVGEAVEYMIKYSDNNASRVFSYAIDTSTLLASYSELGIPLPNTPGYAISARTYGSFFRILYNSTFLSKEYSEQALRLLSETGFKKGLVAGVPSSVKVAHKFGERQINAATSQLHDCGIIYYPGKPYLLCVMTRSSSGTNLDQLAAFIAKVSKEVYKSIDKEEKE